MTRERPKTRYATNGEVSIAYQVVGDGERDLVLIPGFISHVELAWERPALVRIMERLSSFSRLILFDKRGTGMSDPVTDVPTLEQRMDDVRTVMDAAGSQRATLFGISEGAPMSLMFAAAHPERAVSLILYGGMARATEDVDYPYATPREALLQSVVEWIAPFQSDGSFFEIFAPSLAGDQQAHEEAARWDRMAASPSMLRQLYLMFLDIDVRSILPSIHIPTLILHRHGDRVVNVRASRYMAEQIPGAKYVEFEGPDHALYAGNTDAILDEIEEFVTGSRSIAEPDRVLATVLFTDIVGSTQSATRLGDKAWRETLDRHDAIVRDSLRKFNGKEIKATGDGFLATFDGPGRAIQCATAIVESLRSIGVDVRAGLHTGEVEIRGSDVGGIGVHIASRICSLASAGEVLASRTVKDLVAGSKIVFRDRGSHTLRGLPDEWLLFSAAHAE